jgi:hypothetical protein
VQRNYDRPWIVVETNYDKISAKLKRLVEKLLQHKSFLSTYRLQMNDFNKKEMVSKITVMHRRIAKLEQKLKHLGHTE